MSTPTQNPSLITAEAEQASAKIKKEIRFLLRHLGPKDTAKRRKLQAQLRLLTSGKPLDMERFFKERREATLQYYKDEGARAKLLKHQKAMFRSRVRPPLASCGTIVDTRTDASGTKLYAELANGQAIECTRILGLRRVNVDADKLPLKVNNGVRRRILKPLRNPVLVRIAQKCVDSNAARSAE